MTKQEYLAMSLPYRLKVQYDGDENIHNLSGIEWNEQLAHLGDEEYNWWNLSNAKPIVRPLDDIIKPTFQPDYNDGLSFIPLAELAKASHIIALNIDKVYADFPVMVAESTTQQIRYIFDGQAFWFQNGFGSVCQTNHQIKVFQLLLKWHFDLITEDCERVYVSEEFNPYQ